MSSGKRISFALGEVDPTLKYKTNDISFSSGLAKLKNFVVTDNGGVQNRSGFRYICEIAINDPPRRRQDPQVRMFTISNHRKRRRYNPLSEEWVEPNAFESDQQFLFYNGSKDRWSAKMGYMNVYGKDILSPTFSVEMLDSLGYEAKYAQVTEVDNYIQIHFGSSHKNNGTSKPIGMIWVGGNENNAASYIEGFLRNPGGIGVAPTLITREGKGSPPTDMPVSYMVTVVMSNGEERIHWKLDYDAFHPHSQLSSKLAVTMAMNAEIRDKGKYFSIYRSSGPDGIYALVGRIPINQNTILNYEFWDYGLVADPTVTPPVNYRLWAIGGASVPFGGGGVLLKDYRRLMFYQQRLIVAYDSKATPEFEEGAMGASKVGSPRMLTMPDIYNASSAFEFRIPLDWMSEVLFMLPMERGIIFTKKYVFALRGGEKGILTPTTVNPELISEEGCSEIVSPRMSGTRGYFLNRNHSKMYIIEFSLDGNMQINEISMFSSHLLIEEEIMRMEVCKGKADIIWLLRRDGKLVSITANAEGYGFALHETDGFIEDISVASYPQVYGPEGEIIVPTEGSTGEDGTLTPSFGNVNNDCLVALIIRERLIAGEMSTFRALEVMDTRNDDYTEAFRFLDSNVPFGRRLARDLKNMNHMMIYQKAGNNAYCINTAEDHRALGMVAPDGWEAGKGIVLDAGGALAFDVDDVGIFYYYKEGLDTRQELRFKIIEVNISPYPHMIAVAEEDWPEELRDLDPWAESYWSEDWLKCTRWVRATSVVEGLGHLEGKTVAVFADGQVISNPLDPTEDTFYTVQSGSITLDKHYAYGVVGLPYEQEFETLDLDTADDRTFTDKGKLINEAGVAFDKSYPCYIGTAQAEGDLSKMEYTRDREEWNVNETSIPFSGVAKVNLPGTWDTKGAIVIKNIDPVPVSILSVYPKGIIGG